MTPPVIRESVLKFAIAAVMLVMAGCALTYESAVPIVPALPSMAITAAVLPDPSGTVVVGEITCSRSDLPPDTAALLREALEKAFADHGLAPRTGDNAGVIYGFSANVEGMTGGRAGNQLPPAYQLSDVVVRGVLRQAPGNVHACDISHRRSLFREASGTDSYRKLVADIADDIAEELKVRLRGGGHIVQLPSVLDPHESIPTANAPLKIRFYSLQDGRREKRRLGYSVPYPGYFRESLLADRRQVRDYLFEVMRESLCASGHQVVEEGEDVTVAGVLRFFWLWAEPGTKHWDVFAEMEFILELVDRSSGRSKAVPIVVRKQDRLYVPPSPAVFEKVAGEAVSEMLNQIRSHVEPSNFPR